MNALRSDLRAPIDEALRSFAARRREDLADLGPVVAELVEAALEAATGGKHVRPAFCLAGWQAAGAEIDDRIVRAAAALEWLQASALVHDDLIDDSDTRRGRPAAHRRYAMRHAVDGWTGSAERFGLGGAVLLGDLLLTWCDQMFRESGFDAPTVLRGAGYLDIAKNEVVAGQFLDIVQQHSGGEGIEEALRVVRYKSAKYTVERPLHIGAALAGAEPELFATLSAAGLPLGEAFQLRDDVLGVFGDPERTGKPAGDDLREGKRTALVAHAVARADAGQRRRLDAALGAPDADESTVADASAVLVETGALAAVEETIDRLAEQARSALARIAEPAARAVLDRLLIAATRRDH